MKPQAWWSQHIGSLLCLRSPQLCEIVQVTSLKLSKPSFKSHQLTNISFDIIIEAGNTHTQTHTHTWSIIKKWIFIQHVVNMGCAQVALFLRSNRSYLIKKKLKLIRKMANRKYKTEESRKLTRWLWHLGSHIFPGKNSSEIE